MNFQEELTNKVSEIESIIEHFLPAEEGFARSMAETMNYSMRAGGKRIRPLLLLECCRMFGGDPALAEPFAAAMEMIHTHSLIHDDLPALDNDDYRRGRLTVHKVYGEAAGILGGVTLLNYAYETMMKAFDADTKEKRTAETDARIARAMRVMAKKTGLYGMLGGQSVDVENDGKPLTPELLDYIYEHKTSALIEAPMMAGAILAGATEEQVDIMEKAGRSIGLAFQIQDDILDVTSTDEVLGKPIHSDEKNNKVTYVTLYGLEKASGIVADLSEEAITLIEKLEVGNDFLPELIRSLINRKK
ncbi:MAG: polyprenyl synthetase family protein [Clostridiales bacterium]|nr:polyprenyl synthetase family protein [Candidatus Blautia equi]